MMKALFTEWQIWAEQQERGDACSCGQSPDGQCPTHGYEAWQREADRG
jgi:hypothetical protein